MDVGGIQMTLQQFNKHIVSLNFTDKEINTLYSKLTEQDDIIFLTSAKMDGHYWLIACTEEKLKLLSIDLFQQIKSYTISYESIVRLTKKSGHSFSKIELLTAATKRSLFTFDFMLKEDGSTLRQLIKQHQSPQAKLKMKANSIPTSELTKKPFHFHVEGTTGINIDGDSIQDILQSAGKKYARKNRLMTYAGLSTQEIKKFGDGVYEFSEIYLDASEIFFKKDSKKHGDPYALLIYIKFSSNRPPVHIGFVPTNELKAVHKILSKNKNYKLEGHYTGGNTQIIDYNENKESIPTIIPLDLGLEITFNY